MKNTREENIAEHSLETTMIVNALTVIHNQKESFIDPQKMMAYAVYHDVSEVITGDLATPIKYFNPEIRDAYKAIETTAENKLIKMLPEYLADEIGNYIAEAGLSDMEKSILKAADRLSAYIKCVEEVKAGNIEFEKAKASIYNSLIDMNLWEIKEFLNLFGESYLLSLDELN